MAAQILIEATGAVLGVDFMRGGLMQNAQRVAFWQQAGVNGFGAHILGLGDSQFQYRLVKHTADVAATIAFKAAFYALKGQLIAVTDDRGETEQHLLIAEHSVPETVTVRKDGAATKSERTVIVFSGVKAVV